MPSAGKRGGRLAVGLISGTSLDGIDAALVRISGQAGRPRVDLLAFHTFPYPARLRRQLLQLAGGEAVSTAALSEINFRLGALFGRAVERLCRRQRVKLSSLHCIGSHGQTIFHQGRSSGGRKGPRHPASTLQLGEPSLIAARCGVTTVADFRPTDMGLGGQGAPLVPLVDYLLFAHPRLGTVALNIGGIANITVIPRGGRQEDVVGFDTGPGNMVIDALVRRHTRGKQNFDRNGRIASHGFVIPQVLKKCLSHSFLRLRPPKSAGREQFGADFVGKILKAGASHRSQDLIATATELTVVTIVEALKRFVLPRTPVDRLIVSGGGAHNRHLMRRLGEMLPGTRLQQSHEFGIPEDAKEAIAFALLAERTLKGLPGNLPAVTGATRPAILGKVIYASRY